jgi:drug/metabolite transporter (DMT)-like permease
MSQAKDNFTGILYKVANLVTYSVISVIIKFSLIYNVHTFQILLLLNVAGATLTSAIAITKKQSAFSYLRLDKLSISRSVAYVFGSIFWVLCLKYIPINEATALSYLTPLITVFLGVITFRERFSKHVLCSIVLGIIGMYIMLKPFQNDVLWTGVIFAFISSAMWAIHDTIIKSQTNKETPWLYQAHTVFSVVSLILLPFALHKWSPISIKYAMLCLLLGGLTLLNQFFLIKAISKSKLVNLAPISFLRLAFTAAMAYFIFGEIISYEGIIGVAIVLISSSLMVRNAKKIDGGPGKS